MKPVDCDDEDDLDEISDCSASRPDDSKPTAGNIGTLQTRHRPGGHHYSPPTWQAACQRKKLNKIGHLRLCDSRFPPAIPAAPGRFFRADCGMTSRVLGPNPQPPFGADHIVKRHLM